MAASHRWIEDADREQRLQRLVTREPRLPNRSRPTAHDRVKRALDDRVHDALRREVRPELVPTRRLDKHELAVALSKLPGEQLFVDGSERSDREILIVNELPVDAVDAVERRRKERVRN